MFKPWASLYTRPMPRGVLIPEVRQQFFAALERLIAAEGLSGLTGRAVTREAGVATGLLYTHFRTWDNFLAGYATDRSFQIAGGVAGLPGRAGSGTVAANLTGAIGAMALDEVAPLLRLLASRPDLVTAVEEVLGPGMAGLSSVEQAAERYLSAEARLGRLPADVDAGALALALTGVLHRLALSGTDPEQVAERVGRVVAAVVG
jgi:AcrR family transcriptional regulator